MRVYDLLKYHLVIMVTGHNMEQHQLMYADVIFFWYVSK